MEEVELSERDETGGVRAGPFSRLQIYLKSEVAECEERKSAPRKIPHSQRYPHLGSFVRKIEALRHI
jgi:hypothetical protein